jgi:hypothetical protein
LQQTEIGRNAKTLADGAGHRFQLDSMGAGQGASMRSINRSAPRGRGLLKGNKLVDCYIPSRSQPANPTYKCLIAWQALSCALLIAAFAAVCRSIFNPSCFKRCSTRMTSFEEKRFKRHRISTIRSTSDQQTSSMGRRTTIPVLIAAELMLSSNAASSPAQNAVLYSSAAGVETGNVISPRKIVASSTKERPIITESNAEVLQFRSSSDLLRKKQGTDAIRGVRRGWVGSPRLAARSFEIHSERVRDGVIKALKLINPDQSQDRNIVAYDGNNARVKKPTKIDIQGWMPAWSDHADAVQKPVPGYEDFMVKIYFNDRDRQNFTTIGMIHSDALQHLADYLFLYHRNGRSNHVNADISDTFCAQVKGGCP